MNKLLVEIDANKVSSGDIVKMASGLVPNIKAEHVSTNNLCIYSDKDYKSVELISNILIPYFIKGTRILTQGDNQTTSILYKDQWVDIPNESGVFYIRNTYNEQYTKITGYFPTFETALEALSSCGDWCRGNGTGTICFKKFGLKSEEITVLVR